MNVERNVDTVRIEMDIDLAEKLLEVMNQVADWTDMAYDSSFDRLRDMLRENAEIRTPSPLYIARVEDGNVNLCPTTPDLMAIRSAANA